MLYVFHVETGTMMTFEMSLAVESVINLKEYIEKVCKIPIDKQVLLINGGECLDSQSRVCSYSAGTDTNPIFLFNKSVIQSQTPPTASVDYGSEFGKKEASCIKGLSCYAYCNDFTAKVAEAEGMPATFGTVEARAKLAQQFYELDKDQTKVCERLVFDQHLQQQGWAAVVANLEDITAEFKKRAEKFVKIFEEHIKEHDAYLESLKVFHDDLKILEQIPILHTLLEASENFDEEPNKPEQEDAEAEDDEEPTEIDESSSSDASSNKRKRKKKKTSSTSLYEWISAADNSSSIHKLFDHCHYGLEQVNKAVFDRLDQEIEAVINNAEQIELREIKGLSDRLYGLEQLMLEARRCVQGQSDSALSFQQNQTRYGNLMDPSVLPDLCAFHVNQLYLMLNNHTQICDIRRRCMKAKEELSVNLYHRLKWVMYVESKIQETDHNLVICHENLKRLRCNLEVIQQIHTAPAVYMSAIAEVVRRRTFSQAFLLWASELACHLLTIHNDEVTRRKEFQSQFEGHFLNALFPGMSDLPPSFATQAPSIFDSSLPKITVEDIERLKQEMPEKLTEALTVPDMTNVNFFMVKSLKCESDKVDDNRGFEEKLVQVVNEVGLASNLDQNLLKPNEMIETYATASPSSLPHIKDIDRGCDSETDIDEFEKLCQSPLDLNFDKDMMPSPPKVANSTRDASTITEVGVKDPERAPLAPKKPPRTFQKPTALPPPIEITNNPALTSTNYSCSSHSQRTLSISGSQSNTESFTNIKNPSLESIDELSSLRTNLTESCFNSHHQQRTQPRSCSNQITRSKSLSPHTPAQEAALSNLIDQQPQQLSSPISPQPPPNSLPAGHQPVNTAPNEFCNDDFYIDESLPSSLSCEQGHSQGGGEYVRQQLDTANNVVALLQDNLDTSRHEHDRLKSLIYTVSKVTKETTVQLKQELEDFKKFYVLERINLESQCESLTNSFELLCVEQDNKERELVQRLTVDHELEISDYRKAINGKNEEMIALKDNYVRLESRFKTTLNEVEYLKSNRERLMDEKRLQTDSFNKKLSDFKVDAERCAREATEMLIRDHKAEMDNLRTKFRLMTSPTSTAEQQDRIDLDALKQKHEAEKRAENDKYQIMLNEHSDRLKKEFELEKAALIADVGRRVSEEKDKQIELLRERETNLILEVTKYKSTIQQLVESETENRESGELLEKVETLEQEKCQLEAELSMERSRRLCTQHSQDMAASVAIYEGKVDAATSPKRQHRDKLTRSQTSLVKSGKLSLDTCNKGDSVLVIWDIAHGKYMILQDSDYLFFLNSDCLETLGLHDKASEDRKMYCLGEVYDKEYCHAKKAENRYNVPKGTKFYRVKVKPYSTPMTASGQLQQSSHQQSRTATMTQSQVVGPTVLNIISAQQSASCCQSLPNTPTRIDELKSTGAIPKTAIRPASASATLPGDTQERNSATADSNTNRDKASSSASYPQLQHQEYDETSSRKPTLPIFPDFGCL